MKRLLSILVISFLLFSCNSPEPAAEPMAPPPAEPTAPPAAELTGDAYVQLGKDGLAKLSSGDIDGWMEGFADNATFRWNNGDSLVGKPAISDYWKKRRTADIKEISFANDIWLSLKVNTPQNGFVAPGQWLMGWYMVNATYSSGKSMTQWIHTDMHLNADGKIDNVIQYLDRAPIQAAMKP